MSQKFTTGERRGMIILLIILSIIIGLTYFSTPEPAIEINSQNFSVQRRNEQKRYTDSISNPQSRKGKVITPRVKMHETAPVRNPLSQPVPYEQNK